MSSLRAHDLSFSFGSVPLFSGVTFHLSPGWTAVVGENGTGKTTLLELLAGRRKPGSGRVEAQPPGARVVLCEQRVDALSDEVKAFAESEGYALRGKLGLEPEHLLRWPTLSPGERKRWQLAAALHAGPDALLLDEPANHLDASAAGWLLPVLQRFRGVGVIVSHDRALLDALCTQTLRLHQGTADLWPLRWSQALAEWEREEETQRASLGEAKKRARVAAHALDEAKRRHESASRMRSTANRMRNKYDSEARSLGADFRAEQAQNAASAALRRRQRESVEAGAQVEALALEREVGRDVFVSFEPAPRPRLAALIAPELKAGEQVVLRELNLVLGREDRIALQGPNGAGKSTLMRALLEAAALPEERVLYLPQELTAAEGAALLESVRALPKDVKGRVLQLTAALGTDPDRLLASHNPSPGETRKLALASGLGRHAWALFLDEPTNHLDAMTLERLEAALAAYPGALVMATHDARLAEACGCAVWRVENGAVAVR
ncbi:MAG: ABC-F family ATP-binding cassette domain-containing protein [Archangiaceae bacterium]|nr:ABC-F family ATP-binding cassette domain-containing protein [Archangiaceae bacterium]